MEQMSCVYTVKEIQQMLGISKTLAYGLVREPPFPVIQIGKRLLVSKVVFDAWLCGTYSPAQNRVQ